MTDDTCTFSYISAKDFAPKTATGVERSWLDLKLEFSHQGEGLPGARYYKTISVQGPELFAVKHDQTVWYHDQNKWRKYIPATNIKYDKIHSNNLDPNRSTVAPTDDDDEPHFGEENKT
jgi:hypothetical protein